MGTNLIKLINFTLKLTHWRGIVKRHRNRRKGFERNSNTANYSMFAGIILHPLSES